MKTLRAWAIGSAGSALFVACVACSSGGGGSRGLATGVTAGSSGERGRVAFQLSSAERPPGFVRMYVGTETGSYDRTFELTNVTTMNGVSSAVEPRLAQILAQPDVYFVALTFVDPQGRESRFSNEIRVDTRGAAEASVEILRHAFANGAHRRVDGRA